MLRVLFYLLIFVAPTAAFAQSYCVKTNGVDLFKTPGGESSWKVGKYMPLQGTGKKQGAFVQVKDVDGQLHWVKKNEVTTNILPPSCNSKKIDPITLNESLCITQSFFFTRVKLQTRCLFMSTFDPSQAISAEFGIFGLPIQEKEATVVLLPVPWEVTTSYGMGAANGPRIIRSASEQVDLFDLETGKAYEAGYFMREIPADLADKNKKFKAKAQELIELKTKLSKDTAKQERLVAEVNQACDEMTAWTYQQSKEILASGKLLGLIGGDHSCPLGSIQAVSEKHKGDFGVLHLDAHADLRRAYQGFTQSHASIMHNVMSAPFAPKKLVQVGIRDFCEEEYDFIQKSNGRIKTFFDLETKRRMLNGEPWGKIAKEIIEELPKNVYVSFDIDGLNPALCPNTGTPVPGGLSMEETFYLFRTIKESGRRIVGFDLNEVSSGEHEESEWDGNVGARILYKLCGWSVVTNS